MRPLHKGKFLLRDGKQEDTTSASSMTLDETPRTIIRLNYRQSVKTSPLTKIDPISFRHKNKRTKLLCLARCNKENASNITENQAKTTKFLKRKLKEEQPEITAKVPLLPRVDCTS